MNNMHHIVNTISLQNERRKVKEEERAGMRAIDKQRAVKIDASTC